MKLRQKIAEFIKNRFDIRDIFLFLGLSALWRGLYLGWGEWLSDIVCGTLMMIIAYLMMGRPYDR